MKAEIINKDEDNLKIRWSDNKLGFGELTMKWSDDGNNFILDSELIGIDTVIRIFKNLKL